MLVLVYSPYLNNKKGSLLFLKYISLFVDLREYLKIMHKRDGIFAIATEYKHTSKTLSSLGTAALKGKEKHQLKFLEKATQGKWSFLIAEAKKKNGKIIQMIEMLSMKRNQDINAQHCII